MRSVVTLLFFVLITPMAVQSQGSQTSDFAKLMDEGNAHLDAKRFKEAIQSFMSARAAALSEYGEISWGYSNAEWSLILAYEGDDQPDKALASYQNVMRVSHKLPENYKNLIYLTDRLADYLRKKARHKDAAKLYKSGLYLRNKAGETSGEGYYWDIRYTRDYAFQQNDHDSIDYYFEQLFTVLPPGSDSYAADLRDWVGYVLAQNHTYVFNKVEQRCDEYLQLKKEKGQNDGWCAEIWLSYGKLLSARGQHERALNSFSQARNILLSDEQRNTDQYLKILSTTLEAYNTSEKYDKDAASIAVELESENKKIASEKSDRYASNLLTLVAYYRNIKDYLKAELLLEETLSVYEKLYGKEDSDYKNLAMIFRTIVEKTGHTEKLTGLPQLDKNAEKAFIQSSGLGDGLKHIRQLGIYLEKGDYVNAIPFFEKWSPMMNSYYEQGNDHDGHALTSLAIAHCYRETGNLKKAEEFYIAAEKIALEKLPSDHLTTPLVLSNIGEFYQINGAYKIAEDYYLGAIDRLNNAQKTSDKDQNAFQYYQTASKLANLYARWGAYEQSEKLFFDVWDYYELKYGAESFQVASAKNDVANLYRQMELLAPAERLYREAEPKIRKEIGDESLGYINFLSGMASLYDQRGKYKEAEEAYIKCRNLFEKSLSNKSERYIGTVVDMGMMYYHMGQFAKAKEQFNIVNKLMLYQVDNFFPSLSEKEKTQFYGSTSRRFNVYNSFAIHNAKQNPSEANEMFDLQLISKGMLFKATNKMRETVLSSNNDSLKLQYQQWINIKNRLSQVYQMSDDQKKRERVDERGLENAANALEKKISRSSELFANIIVARPSWKTIQAKLKPGEAAIELVRIKDAFPVYHFAFMGKGILYDTLGENGFARVTEIPSDRCAAHKGGVKEGDIITSINDVSTKGKTSSEIQQLLRDNPARIVLKRKTESSPITVTIYSDSIFSRAYERKIVYAALVLKAGTGNTELVVLPNGDELEKRYLRYYQNSISTKTDDAYSYQKFWEPIAATLTDIKKVYISPDGVYNSININTLKNPLSGKYVIDEKQVVIVSNSSDVLIRETTSQSHQAVLLGFPDYYYQTSITETEQSSLNDYSLLASDTSQRFMTGSRVSELPGTKTEVNTIENILGSFKHDVIKYVAAEATEKAIKGVRSPRILHVATHGFFLDDVSTTSSSDSRTITGVSAIKLTENPLLRSGLLLAGAGATISGETMSTTGDDGILTAYEAMNLDLNNTELVVMSACETGRGQIKSGEGVYGLQRAFRSAGAKSILMSLWKVDDNATQHLMTEFYKLWLTNNNKQGSFREAQLALRSKYDHPYYWGAFVMLGE